jgi:hypothetical protein
MKRAESMLFNDIRGDQLTAKLGTNNLKFFLNKFSSKLVLCESTDMTAQWH